MKVRIRVTENDIKKGSKGDGRSCPINRAIRRVIKDDVKYLAVYGRYGQIGSSFLKANQIEIGQWGRDFVNKFDCFEQVSPVRRTVDIPEEYLKRSNKVKKG